MQKLTFKQNNVASITDSPEKKNSQIDPGRTAETVQCGLGVSVTMDPRRPQVTVPTPRTPPPFLCTKSSRTCVCVCVVYAQQIFEIESQVYPRGSGNLDKILHSPPVSN